MRWKLFLAGMLGALAGACSSISAFQSGHSVRVRVGNHEAVERQLEDVAPLVVDYATLALETYQDYRYQLGRARHAIDSGTCREAVAMRKSSDWAASPWRDGVSSLRSSMNAATISPCVAISAMQAPEAVA